MELLSRLSWVDLAIIAVLAAGVFVGYTQGMIRYVLNVVAVLVAFILAAQLKAPLVDLVGFWTAFGREGRELLVFVLLFVGFVIAGWFLIRALYRRTRLPIVKQLDELGGAIFGLLFVAMVLTFQLVVLDSFFRGGPGGTDAGSGTGWLPSYYAALNDSLIIEFFRQTIIPSAGALARPFVPSEIAQLLSP